MKILFFESQILRLWLRNCAQIQFLLLGIASGVIFDYTDCNLLSKIDNETIAVPKTFFKENCCVYLAGTF